MSVVVECRESHKWSDKPPRIVPLKNNGPYGWQYGGGFPTPYRSQLSIQSLCQPISKSNSLSRPSTTSSGWQARQRPQHWAWWTRRLHAKRSRGRAPLQRLSWGKWKWGRSSGQELHFLKSRSRQVIISWSRVHATRVHSVSTNM